MFDCPVVSQFPQHSQFHLEMPHMHGQARNHKYSVVSTCRTVVRHVCLPESPELPPRTSRLCPWNLGCGRSEALAWIPEVTATGMASSATGCASIRARYQRLGTAEYRCGSSRLQRLPLRARQPAQSDPRRRHAQTHRQGVAMSCQNRASQADSTLSVTQAVTQKLHLILDADAHLWIGMNHPILLEPKHSLQPAPHDMLGVMLTHRIYT